MEHNQQLETLLLNNNRIGCNGLDDVRELESLKSVSVLDLAQNKINLEKEEEREEFLDILCAMENLKVLYLKGNPIVKQIPHYRKTLINRLPLLKYLDESPVFPEDRRYAEAFAKGGLEAEQEERKKVREEKKEENAHNHEEFKKMIAKARGEILEKEKNEKK